MAAPEQARVSDESRHARATCFRQTGFFVGNHLSHFDIFVIGWLKASFLAKEEIATWPVFGFLTKLQQTAFISRSAKDAAKVKNNVDAMIDEGKNLIMFPEGTSTRGDTVLDFKSSLFSLALAHADRGFVLQPFTIILHKVDGRKSDTQELKDLYAWDRDNPIDIGPHIWNFAQTKGAELELVFHDPVEIAPGEDRKALARRIQQIVAQPIDKPLELAPMAV